MTDRADHDAAAGFQVVDVSITSTSTADLEMEKLATPPEVYSV